MPSVFCNHNFVALLWLIGGYRSLGARSLFFDSYFRKVKESATKEIRVRGQRAIKTGEYDALADRLDTLGKDRGPTAQPGSYTLALACHGASPDKKGKRQMDSLMAELEHSQIPIVTALKDVVK